MYQLSMTYVLLDDTHFQSIQLRRQFLGASLSVVRLTLTTDNTRPVAGADGQLYLFCDLGQSAEDGRWSRRLYPANRSGAKMIEVNACHDSSRDLAVGLLSC